MNQNIYIVNRLRKLFYVSIAVLANTFLSIILSGLSRWVALGLSIYCVYLMFQLKPENEHYEKAAIFYTVALVGNLISSGILALVGSVCSLVGQYQEFHGHGELIGERDPKLTDNWSSLFWLQFAVSIISTLLSSVFAAVLVASGSMDLETATAIIVVVVAIVTLLLEALYLKYLKKTITILETDSPLPEAEPIGE